MGREIPTLLTVEEAGRLLRIGRTKAYAMAREWRETDGQSGLPVVDLGHVLRVPRRALEELMGVEFAAPLPVPGAFDGRDPGLAEPLPDVGLKTFGEFLLGPAAQLAGFSDVVGHYLVEVDFVGLGRCRGWGHHPPLYTTGLLCCYCVHVLGMILSESAVCIVWGL